METQESKGLLRISICYHHHPSNSNGQYHPLVQKGRPLVLLGKPSPSRIHLYAKNFLSFVIKRYPDCHDSPTARVVNYVHVDGAWKEGNPMERVGFLRIFSRWISYPALLNLVLQLEFFCRFFGRYLLRNHGQNISNISMLSFCRFFKDTHQGPLSCSMGDIPFLNRASAETSVTMYSFISFFGFSCCNPLCKLFYHL